MLLDDGIAVEMVKLLAYWYSRQEMCLKWNSVISECFTIMNGTSQGAVLPPIRPVVTSEECYIVLQTCTLDV